MTDRAEAERVARALFVRDDRGYSPDGLDRNVSDNPATRAVVIRVITDALLAYGKAQRRATLERLCLDAEQQTDDARSDAQHNSHSMYAEGWLGACQHFRDWLRKRRDLDD
jgi:hypothetical protein